MLGLPAETLAPANSSGIPYIRPVSWTPAIGTKTLVARLGQDKALEALSELLGGDLSDEELVWSDRRAVLLDIGGRHAAGLMTDGTGRRLVYWPRVWAARSMAYLGDLRATDALIHEITAEHWRVRMTCIQSLGRLGAMGLTSELVAGLDDEHPRVRDATIVALGRVGEGDAIYQLSRILAEEPENRKVEAAVSNIEERASG